MDNDSRFILLATMRTGSTLLSRAIHHHPAARCLGGLLCPTESIRAEAHREYFPDDDYLAGQSSAFRVAEHYLESKVWPAAPAHAAFRFKLFYGHLNDWKCWQYFETSPGLKCIQLVRNPVVSFVSWRQARQEGVWHRPAGRDIPHSRPLQVDLADLSEYLERHVRRYQQAKALPLERLEVNYGELVQDFDRTMGRIYAFLNLEPSPPRQPLAKINHWDLSQRVTNWEEVASHLEANRPELLVDMI